MDTNFNYLKTTLLFVSELWETERSCQSKNAVNEGAWSVQVVEPILAALDWPRLRRTDLDGTGAYFEWPGKHQVDVALLDR